MMRLTREKQRLYADRIYIAVIVLACVGIAAVAWLGGA